ncbi:hypothetical protein DXT77_00165 [Pseudomonas sp. 91RF]|uniref:hypothetical protein n=1 Tax=Pseudomonas sp. 91RF TaxID=2292261 RepID=UPI000E664B65|nr:hypothetical protein [Pseudomonas sp. 91RF]RIJ13537.1 hypothetical protein DXT77_00165 [Pseudomonas sp. 91RF]
MASEKITNVEVKYKRGNEYEPELLKVTGLGPEDGRGDFGPGKVYYQAGTNWIAFAKCYVGAYDHGAPAMIENVQKTSDIPQGVHNVTVALDKDGPTGISASDPLPVDFQ